MGGGARRRRRDGRELPGRTQGQGLITEPLLRDLGLVVWVTLTRGLGQSALSGISITMLFTVLAGVIAVNAVAAVLVPIPSQT